MDDDNPNAGTTTTDKVVSTTMTKTIVTADGTSSEVSELSNRGVEEKRKMRMMPRTQKVIDKDDDDSMSLGEQALKALEEAEKGELDDVEMMDLKSVHEDDVDVEMKDATDEQAESQVITKHSPPPVYAEYVLDIKKLSALLSASKSASHQIAGKKVLLLVGGTGAGKTTTALYLAGTEFNEVEIDGNDHFEPVMPLPIAELVDFAVSGCSKSVTKTIHAVPIKLKNGETVTLCDTPGFGDSAGAEMDISNGLGIVHALQQAASVTPVLVLNYKNWDFNRYQGLREILGTVRKMMGPDMTDFSSFGYIFTHCEGRGKKKVHKQLTGFLKTNEDDIEDPVLIALIRDMIEKTKPEALAIDPLEKDEADDILEELVSNEPRQNPAECFVPFISDHATKELQVQVSRMLTRVSQSLEAEDISVLSTTMEELEDLNSALSHQDTQNAVSDANHAILDWAKVRQSRVDALRKEMASCDDTDNYKVLSREFRALIVSLSESKKLGDSFGMDIGFDLDQTAASLFADARLIPSEQMGCELARTMKKALQQQDCLCSDVFGGAVLDETLLQAQKSMFKRALFSRIESELAIVKSHIKADEDDMVDNKLEVPWDDVKEGMLLLLDMESYFRSTNILKSLDIDGPGRWSWPQSSIDSLTALLDQKVTLSVEMIQGAGEAMEAVLEKKDEWSWKTEFATFAKDLPHARRLLVTFSSEPALPEVLSSTQQPPDVLVAAFDETLSSYLVAVASFVDLRAQELSKNMDYSDTTKLQHVLEEAKVLSEIAEKSIQMCSSFWDLHAVSLSNVRDVLSQAKGRLNGVVEDAANTAKQQSCSVRKGGNAIKANEEEVAVIKSAKTGAIWYNRYLELVKYQRKNGHCNVPQSMKPLGLWVKKQRKLFSQGKLPEIRETVLQKLGFLFDASDVKMLQDQEKWLENLLKLESFKKREGNFPKMRSGPLGKWLHNQRSRLEKWRRTGTYQRGGYPESMVEDRFEKLNAIGALD